MRLGLLPRVRGRQHLPVAGYGLDDGDRLVVLLVVAQRDLPLDLVEIGGDLAPLLLRALADHVEGVAHLDHHALVPGRVVDPVLADELLAAGGVGLVDADLALGQRQAEPVLLAVLDVEVDADLLVGHRHAVRRAVVVLRAVIDQLLDHGHVGGRHQRELLRLVILDRRAAVQRVEVVFEEALRLEVARRLLVRRRLGRDVHQARSAAPLHGTVDVARHELEGRVAIGGAAAVVDGDPARDVALRVGGIDDHHVVGLPRDAAREVRGLHALRPRDGVAQQPHERRLADEVFRQRGQHETSIVAEVDLAVDLEDGAGGGEQLGLQIRAVGVVEPHHAADVLLHELAAREQVELVVLLEDAQARGIGQRLEMHGGRIDLRRHVRELGLVPSRRQPRLAHVLHEPEVAVVDRHHHVRLHVAADGDLRRLRPRCERYRQRQHHRHRPSHGPASRRSDVCCWPVRQGGAAKVPGQFETVTATLSSGRSVACCSMESGPRAVASRTNCA